MYNAFLSKNYKTETKSSSADNFKMTPVWNYNELH